MILHALADYYRRKQADPDPAQRLPAYGFEEKEIPFILEIDSEGRLVQILDTRSGRVEERRLTDHPGELATINPAHWTRPHRYSWAVASALERRAPFSTGLLKVDAQTRSSRFRDFDPHLSGEPIFVPRPHSTAEDDGWILSMGYDPEHHTGELLVLDAADLRTLCRLRMPHHSPLGFHGTWIPA